MYEPLEEEMGGYGEPFNTFTWERWLEMQACTLQCFARFQRAISDGHVNISHNIVREMQEIVLTMQREADDWIRVKL
jgi:hypothetical protein